MLCDSSVVTQGNNSAVCAELTCMLQKTRSASVLKLIYDRLAETSVDSLPGLYRAAATATNSTFDRHVLLCIARWDSVSCPVSFLCMIANLPLLQTL